MCAKQPDSSVLLLLFLLLFMALVSLRADEVEMEFWTQSPPTIQDSLTSLENLSTQLDEIADYSEQESNLLVLKLNEAQIALKKASSLLGESEASRASLEQSLTQSEAMLMQSEKRYRRLKLYSLGVSALALLLVIIDAR